MSKYIIDTDQFEKLFETKAVAVLGIGDNLAVPEEGEKTVWTRTLNVADLEELTSDYINEHYSDLQGTAYQKGFEDGKKEAESSETIEQAKADAFNKGMLFKEEKIHEAYQRGLEDGKAVNDKGCEGCKYAGSLQGSSSCFNCFNCSNYFKNNWTAKDDKIGVGDVVETKSGTIFAVTKITADGLVVGFTGDGSTCCFNITKLTKTGEHYNINEILGGLCDD